MTDPTGPVTFAEAREIEWRHRLGRAGSETDHGRMLAFIDQCEAERKRARELLRWASQEFSFKNYSGKHGILVEVRAFLEETK